MNPTKFLYSYGGKIVPRHSDGKLRYIGGFTRVLSVDRSISFSELMVKFGELCGASTNLKCKLPNEDLDILISIKSDEELMNVIEEYERVSALTNQELKIRAVLFPIKSAKKVSSSSPPSSPMSCFDFPVSSNSKPDKVSCFYTPLSYTAAPVRCYGAALGYPVGGARKVSGGELNYSYPCCERGSSRNNVYYVAHQNRSQ